MSLGELQPPGRRSGWSGLPDGSGQPSLGMDLDDLARDLFGEETSSTSLAAEDDGPDRVSRMEGGRRFLIDRRRARRRDLLKETVNVGLGSLVVWVVSGILLWQAGASAGVSLLVASVLAVSIGWSLGREVVADVLENEGVLNRGGHPR